MTEKKKSDLSRAFSEDGALKTHVGGQALLEGVMMRGKYNWAVAVREPAGTIYTEEHDLASGLPKNSWRRKPLIRGCNALVESLMLGYKALEIAAIHAFDDEEDEQDAKDARDARDAKDAQDVHECEASKGGAAEPAPAFASSRADASGEAKAPAGADADADAQEASRSNGDIDASFRACASAEDAAAPRAFSWKDDFGRPDTMIDALGAQTSLEVVSEPLFEHTGSAASERESERAEAQTHAPKTALSSEPADEKGSDGGFGKTEMAISMVLGLVLGVVLFIVAPAFVTNLIVGEYDDHTLLWNIVDGLLRVVVFVFYIWLIGRMSDIKRMFGYHGAEHKTIHCYEHGLPLTPENARSFPRLHVRCGTAFLIMVMVIAILVYTIIPLNPLIAALGIPDGAPKLVLVILIRILFMPVIAGISYEITVKWAGSHPDNPLVKVILWPGMQMQYLTTNEPDDDMLECAIESMKLVLAREEAEEAKAAAAKAAGIADARGAQA